jgi:hypothetical protein
MPNCPYCGHDLTPNEIGALYAAVGKTQKGLSRRWGVKLTRQAIRRIRKSKKSIGELAEEHNVSFSTIWRAKENITHNGKTELNCPHCRNELTPREIAGYLGTLGGSTPSPSRVKAAAEPDR